VTTFKRRFSVPFDISIENQEDVILKETTPRLNFTFLEKTESKKLDKNSLLNVLSQGEKRALYLMNILFEINARIRQGQTTLMIIDDIADSFDYKNKYAIIEYLREITSNSLFLTIFLTHNYDFHRTIGSRLDIARPNRHMVFKNDSKVIIDEEKYQNNPFEYWKDNLVKPRFLISSIPFVRNLAEYCGDTDVFISLTSFLHIKSNTEQLTIQDIEDNFKKILRDKNALVLPNRTILYKDILFQEADKIIAENDETMELESKIILAISIRIYAEKYMIKKINNQSFVDAIKKNQTVELYIKFISDPSNLGKKEILDEVNIMTPENIHINSFMFEPILDMSPINLKGLYRKVKALN
jgi:energy-coupling factor transporter ATP-binding protein EcfA2